MLALKVLDENMRSCNNGKQSWKLDKTYRVKGKLAICSNGYHLTFYPEEWQGTRVFLAKASEIGEQQRDKFVCRSVKLIKELSKEELADYEAKRQPLYADYEAKRQTLYADYEAKLQTLYADYEAKRQTLYADYEAKLQPLYADYEAKLQTLYADYEAKLQPLYADYEAKLQPLLQTFLPVQSISKQGEKQ
jgi:hypothetical protein